MSNNIVTRTGEIQEGSDLSLRSPNQYKNYFERALTGHGWNYIETDNGNGGYLKYRLTHEDGTIKDIHVYLKPVVWRNRHADEKAAQMSASIDMRGFEAVNNGELLYVFGIYRDPTSSGDPNSQDDEYVICSWMPTEWGSNRGQAAYNYFIRTDVISEAFKIGFSSAIENGRTVYSFRPESLYYYIINQTDLHNVISDIIEVETPSHVLSSFKEEFCNWFIKQDGLKHNYYSTNFGSNKDKLLQNLSKYEGEYSRQFGTSIFEVPREKRHDFIRKLESNLYQEEGVFFQFSSQTSHHMPRAILGKNNYLKFLNELFTKIAIDQIEFNIEFFQKSIKNTGLIFSPLLIQRFIASLFTKPFVICSGLSGSGKTKLAQSFVQWISESDHQYKIIPVGADWTNREPLLGYPNGLDITSYVTPDSGALQLILEASKEENQSKPYFMILDEMNLSHVERYFADFLSIMESGDSIKLYSGADRVDSNKIVIKKEITWPKNLFIIGTVNIDETTYMFSPKVLDRANVIEFRITPNEMENFFMDRKTLKMEELFLDKEKSKGGAGQSMSEDFHNLSVDKTIIKIPEIDGDDKVLIKFFTELQIVGSEFGYRSATEIELLITKLGINGFVDGEGQALENNTKIDIAIMQKLLPKLHGSRKKLFGPLEILAGFCLERTNASQPTDQDKTKNLYQQFISEKRDSTKWKIKYSISFEKIERMLKNVIENGFTSYAEA